MSNYTITKTENEITLTPKNNVTKHPKTVYNNIQFINDKTDNTIQAKNSGTWTLFSLCSLKEISIPINTHFTSDNKAIFTFTDPKGLDIPITIPITLTNFEETIKSQINPAFFTSIKYLNRFIKATLFEIYTDANILQEVEVYTPPAETTEEDNTNTNDDNTNTEENNETPGETTNP